MIGDRIKQFRKEKGISQEELAANLNVVRQTVSKWETGQSAPDAELLLRIAAFLETPVERLLDLEPSGREMDLSEKLEQAKKDLGQKEQQEKELRRTAEKREIILALSFAAMLLIILIKNQAVSIVLAGACIFWAVIVLYRNLPLLTNDVTHTGALRITTFFNCFLLAAGILFSALSAAGPFSLSENHERFLAMALVSCVILFSGIISPKLPFNRYTGLRLPWTIRDEDTWNLAHKVIRLLSLPIVLLYLACALTIPNFEAVTLCAVASWIGIPGMISYFFYRKKFRKKHR